MCSVFVHPNKSIGYALKLRSFFKANTKLKPFFGNNKTRFFVGLNHCTLMAFHRTAEQKRRRKKTICAHAIAMGWKSSQKLEKLLQINWIALVSCISNIEIITIRAMPFSPLRSQPGPHHCYIFAINIWYALRIHREKESHNLAIDFPLN